MVTQNGLASLIQLAQGGSLALPSLNGGTLPTSSIQSSINAPTLEDVNAKNLQGLSENFKDGQLTPLTAILKGATQGASMGASAKAQVKRDEAQARLNQLLQVKAEHEAALDDMELKAKAYQYSQAQQPVFAQGISLLDSMGDGTVLDTALRGSPEWSRIIQNRLPEGFQFSGLSTRVLPDGSKMIVANGRGEDGSVQGADVVPMADALMRFAPQYVEQQAAAKGALALQQQQVEQDSRLKEAQIGTEQAQRDNYLANAAKVNASADGTVPAKPLPATALKMQNEALGAIGSIGVTNDNLMRMVSQIDGGNLNTDLLSRGEAWLRNNLNASDPQSRALADYTANLKKLVNDSLLLNKGVQTEGDAQRAADAILAAPNDTAAVRDRLLELQRLNQRASDLKKLEVDEIRGNFGHEPMDFTRYEAQASTGPSIGAVEDGYRFKGGNPADKNSWERVQ